LLDALERLSPGPALVKDWVKSMKHYWGEAAFIPDVRDSAGVLRVASRFLELRDEDLVGGLVVPSFEQYQPGEVRSWWVNGQCAVLSAHPDTPELKPRAGVDVRPLAEAVASVRSPFVVVDLAQATTGQWRVVELGDGQVSDRPTSLPAEELLRHLAPTES
jgi:hypothetical protein